VTRLRNRRLLQETAFAQHLLSVLAMLQRLSITSRVYFFYTINMVLYQFFIEVIKPAGFMRLLVTLELLYRLSTFIIIQTIFDCQPLSLARRSSSRHRATHRCPCPYPSHQACRKDPPPWFTHCVPGRGQSCSVTHRCPTQQAHPRSTSGSRHHSSLADPCRNGTERSCCR
jgi:hypothetical protein